LHSLYRLDLIFDLIGTNPDYPTYVAIKGTVFDVSGNKAYGPEGSYKGKSPLSSPVQSNTESDILPSPSSQISLIKTAATAEEPTNQTELSQSSPAKTPPAHWGSPLSNQKNADPTGRICRMSTRKCSMTGSLSSASDTTSKARSRARLTPENKSLRFLGMNSFLLFWIG